MLFFSLQRRLQKFHRNVQVSLLFQSHIDPPVIYKILESTGGMSRYQKWRAEEGKVNEDLLTSL